MTPHLGTTYGSDAQRRSERNARWFVLACDAVLWALLIAGIAVALEVGA